MDFIVPFITGLTTGGLSCLAVQGGLLAGSIAHEVEQSVKNRPAPQAVHKEARTLPPVPVSRPATKGSGKTGKTSKSATKAAHAGGSQASQPVRAAGSPAATAAIPSGRPASTRAGQTGAKPAAHSRARAAQHEEVQARAARPIVLFLSAKLVAYTILGFFLGWLGSMLQLSTTTQALLQAAIGVFMVGTALRMFNVHPIFRYFALEPPRFVTRYIRRMAKDEASAATPVFLGVLTVLIPCGVTQAMMAVAMGSGSPLTGAATMFAFILGTSPVFFAVAYLATRLGSRLEAGFMKAVAVVVLVLGLVSVDAGLTLGGWPYSFSNLRLAWSTTATAEAASASSQGPAFGATPTPAAGQVRQAASPTGPANASQIGGSSRATAVPVPGSAYVAAAAGAEGGNAVTISVAGNGYSPRVTHARPNEPLQMSLVTRNTNGCARAFVIPSLGIQKVLPPTGTTTINVPAQKPGAKLYYSCSMGMYSGMIIFDA